MAGRSIVNILASTIRAGLIIFALLVLLSRSRIDVWPRSFNARMERLPPSASTPYVQSDFCVNLFDLGYLDNFRPNPNSLCVDGSTSNIICYSTHIALDSSRNDTFCMTGSGFVDADAKRITVDCLLRDGDFRASLPRYMYATSVADGLDAMHLDRSQSDGIAQKCEDWEQTLVLVRREGAYHMWDCLLEIFSYYLTIRFMQAEGLLAADSELQVVFLDEYPDGPYAQLWAMFSRSPPVRKTDLYRGSNICTDRIILPLPGGSNPLFQGDWTRFDCKSSSLIEGFRQKAIEYLHPQPNSNRPPGEAVVLTVIHRNHTRHLENHKALVEQLSLIHASAHVQEVDLAAMDFAAQLRIIQGTDVLIGVHGAGLTHTLFLPPRAIVVEIMPIGVQYEGFRNLARLRGLGYLRVHGDVVPASEDWHSADIHIAKHSLEDVVDSAIDLIT